MSPARQKPTTADTAQPAEAENLYALSPRQVIALELVLAGNTDQEIAAEVGVTRQTVNEWKNAHPAFKAEVTRRTRELSESLASRALSVRFKALEVVEDAIEKGNLNAALSYLRLTMPAPDTSGPIDPRDVIAQDSRSDPVADLMKDIETKADRGRVEAALATRLRAAEKPEEQAS